MRTHTNDFKTEIAPLGRQIKGKIYHYFNYEIDTEASDKIITENDSYLILEGYNKDDKEELTDENIYSMKLIKNGELLQSLMKQFNFEAKYDLRIGDVINPHFGLLVNGEYEFLDYGDYIIYSKQYNANNDTWDYVCYDLMLYSMIQYNGLNISYPITVKNYINAIANKMGVGFTNINDAFTNSEELIYKDLFKDKNKTYRDILDKLSEITASNILINDDNELEVYYPKYAGEITDVSNSSIEITDGEEVELQAFEIEGKTTQENTPTPDNPSELVSVGYENMYEGSQDFSGTWNNSSYWETDTETYNSLVVKKRKSSWSGISKDLNVESGKTYTFSVYIKSDTARQIALYTSGGTSGIISQINYTTSVEWGEYTLTFTATTSGTIRPRVENTSASDTNYTYICGYQLVEGTQAHSYIPYGKYGIEVKTTGKNLFDKNSMVLNAYINLANQQLASSNDFRTIYIPINSSTTYTLQKIVSNRFVIGYSNTNYSTPQILTNVQNYSTNRTELTFTTPNDAKYLFVMVSKISEDTTNITDLLNSIQLEENTQKTTYEEYKSNTYLYTLDNPLRSIGDVKDLLYIKNGYLYVDRKIGRIVYNGTESGWNINTSSNVLYKPIPDKITSKSGLFSNYYKYTTTSWNLADNNTISEQENNYYIFIKNTNIASVTAWQTWLSTHNTEVQYILAEPYTEELGQVETPETYEGITYIETTDSNEPTMNVSYISEFEEIDEEYLKDVNVNFGEKFGQINRVALRDTENKIEYVAQDNISIEKNKLTQINIIDNPITLNGNEDNICQNILNKLNGLYYSINDFTTTGLCYYDFLDIFFVKIKDTRYQCLLLNNEITITQGIEETIFADAKSNSQVEGSNYETNYLTNKDIQTKITQLNDTKVESKSVINSINDSKERAVISTEKIMYIKDFTGTTDANGFLDIELNADFVVCSATASFNSNDYGFVIPYYDYNSGSPKWELKIKDKNDVAVANTQIATTIYYFKKERDD